MSNKIYCISGLGADFRIFKNLHLPGYELVGVPWHSFDKYDELPCYAQKMSSLIKEENPILLGVSFGGMLASEIGKIRSVRKNIIISSCKSAKELPPFGKFFTFLIKSRILPPGFFNIPNKTLYRLFGTETPEENKMLDSIIRNSDGAFMKWALFAIQHWQSATHPENIFHIHGRKDLIIPPTLIHPDNWIEDGGHLMIYNRAEKVNPLIMSYLKKP